MAHWRTTLDLTTIWPKDEDDPPDVKGISREIARQLRELDLSFLPEDDRDRQMAIEHADEFQELSEQYEPKVEDLDQRMQDLYDWADAAVPGGRMCWIATVC